MPRKNAKRITGGKSMEAVLCGRITFHSNASSINGENFRNKRNNHAPLSNDKTGRGGSLILRLRRTTSNSDFLQTSCFIISSSSYASSFCTASASVTLVICTDTPSKAPKGCGVPRALRKFRNGLEAVAGLCK